MTGATWLSVIESRVPAKFKDVNIVPSNLDESSWRNTSKTFFVAAESPRVRSAVGRLLATNSTLLAVLRVRNLSEPHTEAFAVVDRVFALLSVSSDVLTDKRRQTSLKGNCMSISQIGVFVENHPGHVAACSTRLSRPKCRFAAIA